MPNETIIPLLTIDPVDLRISPDLTAVHIKKARKRRNKSKRSNKSKTLPNVYHRMSTLMKDELEIKGTFYFSTKTMFQEHYTNVTHVINPNSFISSITLTY